MAAKTLLIAFGILALFSLLVMQRHQRPEAFQATQIKTFNESVPVLAAPSPRHDRNYPVAQATEKKLESNLNSAISPYQSIVSNLFKTTLPKKADERFAQYLYRHPLPPEVIDSLERNGFARDGNTLLLKKEGYLALASSLGSTLLTANLSKTSVPVGPGAAQGIQIGYVSRDSILETIGLQSSDVLTSLNGLPTDNMTNLAKSLTKFHLSGDLPISYIRGGEQVTDKLTWQVIPGLSPEETAALVKLGTKQAPQLVSEVLKSQPPTTSN